jgi:hypothetical protein
MSLDLKRDPQLGLGKLGRALLFGNKRAIKDPPGEGLSATKRREKDGFGALRSYAPFGWAD